MALENPREVVKLPIPEEFPRIPDALTWALEVAQQDPNLFSTAMRSAFQDGPQDDQMIYASRGQSTDKVRSALIDGVRRSAPVQLQVNGINRKFSPIEDFLQGHLWPAVRRIDRKSVV